MKVEGKHYRTIWEAGSGGFAIEIIDQRYLPHDFVIERLITLDNFCSAISDMHVRGAPLIGITAAYGIYIAALEIGNNPHFDDALLNASHSICKTRPTAVNLEWAVNKMLQSIHDEFSVDKKLSALLNTARRLADEDIANCISIGNHGFKIIEEISKSKFGQQVNILTHCNAGWLATVDYGTATAPIYKAFDNGIPIHIWVDETRPRNQGARLTAWELNSHGIPHTVIVDNAGGHLMQHGMVDMVIVGCDRATRQGDVANKIGTYLKALAAKDCDIPFYVALPTSTIDLNLTDGIAEIPIEQRNGDEVRYVEGLSDGKIREVLIPPESSPAANYGFDVTPARLITGLITEKGICNPCEEEIVKLFQSNK
ncbi:MAG: mtnA [Ignavibacteria bacterium]|nr:mtnA [Ignavibacteria bacterium]